MVLVSTKKGQDISIYDVLAYLGILVVILACMSAYSRAREMLHRTFGYRRPKVEELDIEGRQFPGRHDGPA